MTWRTVLTVHQGLYIVIWSWLMVSEACVRVIEIGMNGGKKETKRWKMHGEWVKRRRRKRRRDSIGNSRNTLQGHNFMWLASLWMAWITAAMLQLSRPPQISPQIDDKQCYHKRTGDVQQSIGVFSMGYEGLFDFVWSSDLSAGCQPPLVCCYWGAEGMLEFEC